MDQSNFKLSNLESALGGKLPPNGWRIHVTANRLDFLPRKGLQNREFGDIPGMQDHLYVLEWAGHKLLQLPDGLHKMCIGNDPNFHVQPNFPPKNILYYILFSPKNN
jgi:hypothetical protein